MNSVMCFEMFLLQRKHIALQLYTAAVLLLELLCQPVMFPVLHFRKNSLPVLAGHCSRPPFGFRPVLPGLPCLVLLYQRRPGLPRCFESPSGRPGQAASGSGHYSEHDEQKKEGKEITH